MDYKAAPVGIAMRMGQWPKADLLFDKRAKKRNCLCVDRPMSYFVLTY